MSHRRYADDEENEDDRRRNGERDRSGEDPPGRDARSQATGERPRSPVPIWLVALVLLIAAGGWAIRYEILGRGEPMAFAYPIGLLAQVFFGVIACWAAAGAIGAREVGPLWSIALRIACLFAVYDAGRALFFNWAFGSIAVLAFVHLLLMFIFFARLRAGQVIFIAAILFLLKTVGTAMVVDTWYTWFTA